jgi:hypothetical protein
MRWLAAFTFCTVAWADAKSEAELRQRLAESEAARTVLANSIAKLTASQNRQSAVAAIRGDSADAQRSEQTNNAAQAAQTANVNAVIALAASREQTDQLLRAADSAKWGTYATLGVTAFGFMTLVFTALWKSHTDKVTRQEARLEASEAHAEALRKIAEVKRSADTAVSTASDTKSAIAALESNTNSKMDQLLQTTSDAQFAKGIKQGAEDATASLRSSP